MAEDEKWALQVQQPRGLWWAVPSHTESVREEPGGQTQRPEDLSRRGGTERRQAIPRLGLRPALCGCRGQFKEGFLCSWLGSL